MYSQSQLPDPPQVSTGGINKPILRGRQIEDPLEYFPCSTILNYSKRQSIYGQDQPSTNIYLVIEESQSIPDCRRPHCVIFGIYQANKFFGESSFLGGARRENAVAIETTKLMTWAIAEIEEIAIRRPRILLALRS